MASPRSPAWDDVMVGIASWHAEVRVFRTRDVTRILLDGLSKEDQSRTIQWPLS